MIDYHLSNSSARISGEDAELQCSQHHGGYTEYGIMPVWIAIHKLHLKINEMGGPSEIQTPEHIMYISRLQRVINIVGKYRQVSVRATP